MAQENGNGVRFRVVAEVVRLGDMFGFGSVVSLVYALARNNEEKWVKTDKVMTCKKPIEDEGIFLPDFALDHLEGYEEGDEVELAIGKNTTEDPKVQKNTPWWCYFVYPKGTNCGNGAEHIARTATESFEKLQEEALELLSELDELDSEHKNSVGVEAEQDLLLALENADYKEARKTLVRLRGVLRGIKSADEKRLAVEAEAEKRRATARAVAEAIRNRKRQSVAPATNTAPDA